MKFLVFVAPHNFRDETISMLKMFFERWGIQYTITSYANKDCIGAHGAVCKPGINTGKVLPSEYDGIVLVDGDGIEDYKLFEYRPLLDLLLQFNGNGKYVAAFNNAIKVVARANIIKDKKISLPRDPEAKRMVLLFKGVPSNKPVEVSGNIITMNGTSLEAPIQEMLAQLGAI